MKKTSIILFIIVNSLYFSGQHIGESFILNEEVPPHHTMEWLASEYIYLIPNFSASPNLENHVSLKVDPLMIFPPEGGETGGSQNNNTGGVVGTLPGDVTVTPAGGAGYTIPINIPVGTAGMTPSLSINYNSQSGNGFLGMGWSMSGLSAITLAGTNFYHEGFIDGVDFDENDKLALDGQRLIPINTEETEYRTEIESFSKIVYQTEDWFEISSKDGLIYQYGKTNDSKIEAGDDILMWLVNRVTDRKGNYISFEYIEENGIGRISKISYTGNSNTNLDPYYEIKFEYMDLRNDPITQYINGAKIEINELLEFIYVIYENNTILTYQLNYNSNDLYTILEKITLSNSDGEHYNPTLFEWGENTEQFLGYYSPFFDPDFRQIPGDYNGDGLTDIAQVPKEIDIYSPGHIDLFINRGDAAFEQVSESYFPSEYFLVNDNNPASYLKNSYDFDGDGLQDMVIDVIVYIDPENEPARYYHRLDIYYSLGDRFDHQNAMRSIYLDNQDIYNDFDFGDFNGDGRTDIILLKEDDSWKILLSTGMGFSNLYGLPLENGNEIVNTDDYNSDGKSEIMFYSEQGCNIVELSGTTLTSLFSNIPGYPTIWHTVFNGDFNGDGNADILSWHEDVGWELHYFDGQDFDWVNNAPPGLLSIYGNRLPPNNHRVGDFNGDGNADIFEYGQNSYNSYECHLNVFFSNGSNFIKENNTVYSIGTLYLGHQIGSGDYNGDGKEDLNFKFIWGEGGLKSIAYFHPKEQNNLIQKVTNGLGKETKIDYSQLTNNNIYTKGDGSDYPVVDVQPALNVVKSINTDNGVGGELITHYIYEGAKVHVQGKGFLGYKKTILVTNPNTLFENRMENYMSYDNTFYFTFLDQQKYFSANPEGVLTEISTTHYKEPVIEHFGDKRIFYYVPTTLHQVHHTGDYNSEYVRTVRTDQIFSAGNDINHGNISSVKTYSHSEKLELHDPVSDYDFSTEVNYTYYYNDLDIWLINLLKSMNTLKESSEDITGSKDEQEITYTYYERSPYVKTEESKPNNNATFRVNNYYVYDEFGNVTKKVISTPGFTPSPPDRITNYIYSSDYQHRFVTNTNKTVDETDFINTATYYAETGLIESETNINGLVTSYLYDGFGRLAKSIYPDNTQKQQHWRWTNAHGDNPIHGLYMVWSQNSGSSPISTFFDKIGHELRNVTYNFKDEKIYLDNQYDFYGNLSLASRPYYAGEQIHWTAYTYLSTGAQKTIVSPTSDTEFTYNGLEITTENHKTNISVSKKKNAIGKVILSTDPCSLIEYNYYSSGLLHTVEIEGNKSTIVYDDAGFRDSFDDPDAGLSTYKYNPFGELIEQTDARGKIYDLTYDALGRLKRKLLVNDAHFTYYTYDEDENAIGNISSIINSWNGISYNFSYDNFTRLKEKSETINGEEYILKYDYNVFGDLKSEIWPSDFKIDYHYNNGFLVNVRNPSNGVSIWELTDVTSKGQIKQYMLGNNLLTTKSFTPNGFLTDIETDGVQHLKYQFNEETGNLTWREDFMLPGKPHEEFTYDNKLKSRLETWQVTGQQQYAIDYSNNGNFNSKSDIGSNFVYGDATGMAGPHAIVRIDNPSTSYLEMSREIQDIEYTGFNKTESITVNYENNNRNGSEEKYKLDIIYGPENKRKISSLQHDNQVIKTKVFVGSNFEIISDGITERKLHYITGGDGLCAVYELDDEGTTGKMHYILKDHLGSIYAITDDEGDIVTHNGEEQIFNYDPWGRRRNPYTWTFDDVPTQFLFDRGFTQHEHLDELDLINMNGRMYESWLGRFLSPDNFTQAPEYSQNLNRYSYAYNNPLLFTDPSGYFTNHFTNSNLLHFQMQRPQLTEQQSISQLITGFAIAAFSALIPPAGLLASLPASFANTVASYAISSAISGFAGSFVGAATSTWLTGGSFVSGFNSGVTAGMYGMLYGMMQGAMTGAVIWTTNSYWKLNKENSEVRKKNVRTSYPAKRRFNKIIQEQEDLYGGLSKEEYYLQAIDGMELPNGITLTRDNVALTFIEDFTDIDSNAAYGGIVDGKHHINFTIGDFEETVANIRVTVIHELYGHGIKGWGDGTNTHWKCYAAEVDSKYFTNTTDRFKVHTLNQLYSYYFNEHNKSFTGFPSRYLPLIRKYYDPSKY